jgi:hypothetical protein
MALPLLVPLILLGGATIALAAASSKRKRVDDQPSGPTKTYTLDSNMPAMLRDQVLAALQSEADTTRLEAFARGIERQYPLAASALRTKEAMLAPPIPSKVAPPAPGPSAPIPTAPQPQPPQPLLDWQAQLMAVPDPPRSDVLRAMMGMNDPNQLESFARSLDANYPIAAWVLRVREAALRGMTPPPQPAATTPTAPAVPVPIPVAPAPQPSFNPPPAQVAPAPVPVVPPPPAPPVSPVMPAILPLPSAPSPLAGLDPNMPAEMQKAVAGALTTESDPAKLEGFASAIQAQYPIAAGLLAAKAQALRFAQLPHGLPIPSFPTVPVPPSPPVPVSPRPQVPSGGGGITPFPASGTYVVISGDYPIKITQKFTGNGNRWKELIAANPDKPTRADGAWTTLMPGEIIKLPQAWNNSVSAKAPSLALPPAGGTHAANA